MDAERSQEDAVVGYSSSMATHLSPMLRLTLFSMRTLGIDGLVVHDNVAASRTQMDEALFVVAGFADSHRGKRHFVAWAGW